MSQRTGKGGWGRCPPGPGQDRVRGNRVLSAREIRKNHRPDLAQCNRQEEARARAASWMAISRKLSARSPEAVR